MRKNFSLLFSIWAIAFLASLVLFTSYCKFPEWLIYSVISGFILIGIVTEV